MLQSYFDLGASPVAVQRAAADSLQVQQTKRLAVAPPMNLKSAIESQTQNRAAQQNLATNERRIALAEDRQQFDEGQIPWATAGGALSAGVQLYGGWNALQNAQEVKARLDRNDAIQQETLRQGRETTKTQTGILGRIADIHNTSARPLPWKGTPWALPVTAAPPPVWQY